MTTDSPLTLYRFSLSGHSHRAQLLISLAGLPHQLVEVDLKSGAQKSPEFLSKNPFGQVPVLSHGDFVISESNAILLYLADAFPSAGGFWPKEVRHRALVQRWFSIASGPLLLGPGVARLVRLFGRDHDFEQAVAIAANLFRVMEQELTEREFLVGPNATLADISMYTYTAHAPEGDISLEPYPHVRAWLRRIEALPRFVPMVRTSRRN